MSCYPHACKQTLALTESQCVFHCGPVVDSKAFVRATCVRSPLRWQKVFMPPNTNRSASSLRGDCRHVFCSRQPRGTTRACLPAHKGRFTATPGHGRWCYKCSADAHYSVPIRTCKHSPSHRARAHKIDSSRSRALHSRRAHSSVHTNTMSRTSDGF